MKKNKLLITLAAGLMALSATAAGIHANETPVHRPIIEEYTGTWCGWCVRGLVGMELLSQNLGEDFIGVAYHNSDAMQTYNSNAYPNNIDGFPSAFVDRTIEVDPFYGTGSASGGIVSFMQQYAAISTNASIDVTAQWANADKTEISVTVNTYFTEDIDNAAYAVEVMLIADDLYGTGSSWNQSNYYSGNSYFSSDPYLGPWVKKGSSVSGIHYNDVLLLTSKPISSSIPSSIVAYDDYSYNYTILLTKLPKPALVQNKDNLRIIALVVNNSNGSAVNANRCYISDYIPVIIGDVDDDGEVGINDVSALLDYLLTGNYPINQSTSDVSPDGQIDILDVTALISLLLTGDTE